MILIVNRIDREHRTRLPGQSRFCCIFTDFDPPQIIDIDTRGHGRGTGVGEQLLRCVTPGAGRDWVGSTEAEVIHTCIQIFFSWDLGL